MRGRRTMLSAAVLTLVAVLIATVPASAHVTGFGPQQVLADRVGWYGIAVDAAADAGGTVHGFASFGGPVGATGYTAPVKHLVGRGSSWRLEPTPYRGDVVAVAHDATGTYLLYSTPNGLRIAKRLTSGRYTAGHLLAAPPTVDGRPGRVFDADLVAADGRWWAVWALSTGGGLGSDLHEAGTIGGTPVRARVAGQPVADVEPALALSPSGGGWAADLVWTRAGGGGQEVWAGRATRPGAWSLRPLITGGRVDAGPQVARVGGTLHVAWLREGRPWYAEDSGRGLRSRRLSATASQERLHLGVSGAEVVVLWPASGGSRVLLTNRHGTGPWQTTALWTNSYDWSNFALAAAAGRVTVLVGATKSGQLLARSQG